jgi:hypothetical protein
MKKTVTKATYSLDPLTVMEIQELAAVWSVPKSEVIRRSVHLAASNPEAGSGQPQTPLEALDALQSSPRLDKKTRECWAENVRRERRSAKRP